MKKGQIIIEWDKTQWFAYHTQYGKYNCFGLGESPEEALLSFQENIEEFKENADYMYKMFGISKTPPNFKTVQPK